MLTLRHLKKWTLQELKLQSLAQKCLQMSTKKRVDPRGKVYYWMAGELTTKHEEDGTDISAVRANRISITPITFEMTHKAIMAELEREFCKDGICDWYGYGANQKD